MRFGSFVFAALIAALLTSDSWAQCQRGGGRSQPGSFAQPTSFAQPGLNPLLAAQQAAMQQQLQFAMQQQAVLQNLRRQQHLARARADQEKLDWRRAGAAARRAAILAKRERVRQQNLARLEAGRSRQEKPDEVTAFVSLREE